VKASAISIVAIVFLAGCATVSTPVSKDASAQLQGKTLVRSHYSAPDFTAFSAGKAAFIGLLGIPSMIAEGNSIIKANEIADPAIEISQALSKIVASKHAMKAVESSLVAASDDPKALATTYTGADYILDVKTSNWAFIYYPTDWSHYKVAYRAQLRLIDAARQTVVAESSCLSEQGDEAKRPSKEQLLENRARLLKSYLAKAASSCADVFARDVFQL
jgi:hypothetical protein